MSSAAHPLLTVREEINRAVLILITANRGLAGSYNSAMVAQVERFIAALNVPVDVITIGKKGRDLMIRRGYNIIATFDDISDTPSILDVTPIARLVTDDYLHLKYDEVFIGYTDFVNLIARHPAVKQLLPLKPLNLEGMAVAEYVTSADLSDVSERAYTYEPDPAQLLDNIVPRFTQLQIYQSVLEALASEHSARYVAMNSATDNAAELVDILTLERNKARQASITNEILDIVGGAAALAG
jgi:F-type H+-transporting ATPase subunit gamma